MGGLGLAGLFIPPPRFNFEDPFTAQQGRVTTRSVWMYDRPSAKAKPVRLCPRDTLLPISGTAVSDEDDSHNRVWYEAGSEGFVHSGNIQPVRTLLNTPRMDIPKTGFLAEVSVPFTDAFESADKTSTVIYRLYYETTHWVKSAQRIGDTVWYQVRDDKYRQENGCRIKYGVTGKQLTGIPGMPEDSRGRHDYRQNRNDKFPPQQAV